MHIIILAETELTFAECNFRWHNQILLEQVEEEWVCDEIERRQFYAT